MGICGSKASSGMAENVSPTENKYKMSHVKKPLTYKPEKRTILDFLRQWSETKPTENAFVFLSSNGDRETVTWKELYDNSVQYAKAFINLGVKKGDVVGITLPCSPKWLYVAFGANFAGAIPAGIVFTYTDGSDVIAVLNKIASCSTYVLDTDYDVNTWRIFQTFLSSYSKDGNAESKVIPSLRYVLSTSKDSSASGVLTVDELLQIHQGDVELPVVKPEDTALLLQTSGSTGTPKVVAHVHASLTHFAGDPNIKKVSQLSPVLYNDRPFNWVGGWPISVLYGQTRVLRSGYSEEPTNLAQFVIDAVKKEKCTTLSVLPPLLYDIMNVMSKKDSPEGKMLAPTIGVSGQPISKTLSACIGTLCRVMFIGYGATEFIFVLAAIVRDPLEFQDNCCGSVSEGFEVKVVNEKGKIVPIGTRGELLVRGPTMFSGYINDPEKTRAVLSKDGWYKTDDIGFMNEDGQFFVEGRMSDMIISGGFNVPPGILESVIKAMPGVRDAVIVPIPDKTSFQILCACVILNTGSDVTEDKLQKYCEDLHNDKAQVYTVLPSHYLFFDKFPETESGKTKRKDLAEEAIRRIASKQSKEN